jgi:hypothetical protein
MSALGTLLRSIIEDCVLTYTRADEANIIATSLFFGAAMDRGVRRGGSSADIRRAVAGADPASRRTIGLIAFSQAFGVKVVPLSDLPAPSAVSIASRRYPYWWTIAVESDSSRSAGAAVRFGRLRAFPRWCRDRPQRQARLTQGSVDARYASGWDNARRRPAARSHRPRAGSARSRPSARGSRIR